MIGDLKEYDGTTVKANLATLSSYIPKVQMMVEDDQTAPPGQAREKLPDNIDLSNWEDAKALADAQAAKQEAGFLKMSHGEIDKMRGNDQQNPYLNIPQNIEASNLLLQGNSVVRQMPTRRLKLNDNDVPCFLLTPLQQSSLAFGLDQGAAYSGCIIGYSVGSGNCLSWLHLMSPRSRTKYPDKLFCSRLYILSEHWYNARHSCATNLTLALLDSLPRPIVPGYDMLMRGCPMLVKLSRCSAPRTFFIVSITYISSFSASFYHRR